MGAENRLLFRHFKALDERNARLERRVLRLQKAVGELNSTQRKPERE